MAICPSDSCVYPFNLPKSEIHATLVAHLTAQDVVTSMMPKMHAAGVEDKVIRFMK